MISRRDVNKDLIGAGVGLILSAAYLWGALQIPKSSLIGKGVGADALPFGLAACLAGLSTILLLRSLWARSKLPMHRASEADLERKAKEWYRHKRAGGMFLLGLGYLLILDWVGYIPSIFLLVAATAVYSGRPLALRTFGFAAIVTTAFYLLFDFVLKIPMPMGIWPDIWEALYGA
jgi:hypothetical protein